jgi:lipoprotein-anchoring transpeptidase ErfK/SrfK
MIKVAGQGRPAAIDRRAFVANLVSTLLIASGLLVGLPVLQAAASTGPQTTAPPVQGGDAGRAAGEAPLRLAQYGNVEIYIDEYGRRVIVDAFTGEVLGVERPGAYRNREAYRRALRNRELGRDPGYDIYDPNADIPYKPRPYVDGHPVGEDPGYSREPVPEAPQYAYPDDQYPEAPQAYPDEPQPRDVTRGQVERKKLGDVPGTSDDQANVGTYKEWSTEGDGSGGGQDQASVEQPGEQSSVEPGITPPSIAFGARDEVAALQVLLDRKGASSGVIDGRFGSNVDKALIAYRDITGENLHSTDSARIKTDLAASGGDAFVKYTITAEDAAGPYVASVPADYGAKAKLDRLGYTSVSEMLAERFHMDEGYLKALNPGANFGRPGTVIKVANVGGEVKGEVARIVADKRKKEVFAYDSDGKLLAAYPATIGSDETPSPSGTHQVSRVAFDPQYTYNPKLNFKQGDNDKVLTIPPGPNGPVGSIWIALDKPTYGIHGTPDPSKIGKAESHGCVRLTNWDAAELARMVKPGVEVEFVD